MIQTPYDCESFKPNDNLNLTCEKNKEKKRCLLISYSHYCRDFTEKTDKKSRKKSQGEI